jgi:D-sedoheptulose 7-phosphate isomerase
MSNLLTQIQTRLAEAQRVNFFLKDSGPVIMRITEQTIKALKQNKTVYLFGNGGSAADAQHLATELACRMLINRPALPAIALTTNTSLLTAIANDYSSDEIFARQVMGLVKKGDIVIALSTSGNSANILSGVKAARKCGAYIIGFTGETGGRLKNMVDICFCAPSNVTARIQECHITAGHIICELVEKALAHKKNPASRKRNTNKTE